MKDNRATVRAIRYFVQALVSDLNNYGDGHHNNEADIAFVCGAEPEALFTALRESGEVLN